MTPAERARIIMDELPRWMPNSVEPQVIALLVLLDGARPTTRVVGERLGMSQPAVCKLIDKAVQLDLVERFKNEWDRRATLVRLTPKGRRVRQRRRGGSDGR